MLYVEITLFVVGADHIHMQAQVIFRHHKLSDFLTQLTRLWWCYYNIAEWQGKSNQHFRLCTSQSCCFSENMFSPSVTPISLFLNLYKLTLLWTWSQGDYSSSRYHRCRDIGIGFRAGHGAWTTCWLWLWPLVVISANSISQGTLCIVLTLRKHLIVCKSWVVIFDSDFYYGEKLTVWIIYLWVINTSQTIKKTHLLSGFEQEVYPISLLTYILMIIERQTTLPFSDCR